MIWWSSWSCTISLSIRKNNIYIPVKLASKHCCRCRRPIIGWYVVTHISLLKRKYFLYHVHRWSFNYSWDRIQILSNEVLLQPQVAGIWKPSVHRFDKNACLRCASVPNPNDLNFFFVWFFRRLLMIFGRRSYYHKKLFAIVVHSLTTLSIVLIILDAVLGTRLPGTSFSNCIVNVTFEYFLLLESAKIFNSSRVLISISTKN